MRREEVKIERRNIKRGFFPLSCKCARWTPSKLIQDAPSHHSLWLAIREILLKEKCFLLNRLVSQPILRTEALFQIF